MQSAQVSAKRRPSRALRQASWQVCDQGVVATVTKQSPSLRWALPLDHSPLFQPDVGANNATEGMLRFHKALRISLSRYVRVPLLRYPERDEQQRPASFEIILSIDGPVIMSEAKH